MSVAAGPNIIEKGLVLCLDAGNKKSYPGSGTVWRDLITSKNGALTNGPTYSSANGGYIRCDGSNDFIEVTDNSSLDFGAGNFTVEYWFRKLANTSGFSNIWGVNKWNTGATPGTNEWSLTIGDATNGNGNNYSFGVQVGNTSYGAGLSLEVLTLNIWYQLIGIREGGSLKTYLNGILKQDVSPVGFSASSSINNVGRNLRINNSALNALYTNCDNAIVRIYNRALTPTEILQNYNATKGRFRLT